MYMCIYVYTYTKEHLIYIRVYMGITHREKPREDAAQNACRAVDSKGVERIIILEHLLQLASTVARGPGQETAYERPRQVKIPGSRCYAHEPLCDIDYTYLYYYHLFCFKIPGSRCCTHEPLWCYTHEPLCDVDCILFLHSIFCNVCVICVICIIYSFIIGLRIEIIHTRLEPCRVRPCGVCALCISLSLSLSLSLSVSVSLLSFT